jgi:predicted ribonuclease YlaK
MKRLRFTSFSLLFIFVLPSSAFLQVPLRMIGPEDAGGAWAEIIRRFHDKHPNISINYVAGPWYRLPYTTIGTKGDIFKPLNLEQECYFDLLNDDTIPIKVCTGIAGSGKTKSALKFGFHKINSKDSLIEKIMIIRNPVSVGEEVGFFKGDKNEKLACWNNPARDNLENESMLSFEDMVARGLIEMEIPATMQGRDLKNTWIIVDECQQMTYEQVKMIGSRVAYGSQIIFIGDLDQTFLKKYKDNNGLEKLYNLRGHQLVGVVDLKEDVRSEVSKLFATSY